MHIWETLGISPTNDLRAIQSAFARRVRECHPEENPEGFQALNEAYRAAIGFSRRMNADEDHSAAVAPGAIREYVPEETEEGPTLGTPVDGAWAEEDESLDFGALIAKGVLADLQPPPKHLGRIQKVLTQPSPTLKAWAKRYL